MIPYTSQVRDITDVTERNTAFNALSQAEQRSEVAYDVIRRYEVGLLQKQQHNQYWPNDIVHELRQLETAEQLQDAVIEKHAHICDVCARGAVMVSRIMLGNKISPRQSFFDGDNEWDEETDTYKDPAPEFNQGLLNDIENYYEKWGFLRYRQRTPECIAALMANIVANKEFDENDKTDYLVLWGIPVLNDASIFTEGEMRLRYERESVTF